MNFYFNLKVYVYFLNICIFYIKLRYLRNLYCRRVEIFIMFNVYVVVYRRGIGDLLYDV